MASDPDQIVDGSVMVYDHPGSSLDIDLLFASEPLPSPDTNYSDGTSNSIGFSLAFGKEYAQRTGNKVIIVHHGLGGTGFTGNHWNPGDTEHADSVTRVNQVLGLDNSYVFGGILWHQGEADATFSTEAQHAADMDAAFNSFRAQISDGDFPIVVGELSHPWVGVNADRLAIQAAIQDTPNRLVDTAVVDTSDLPATLGDLVHFSASDQRIIGVRYVDEILAL